MKSIYVYFHHFTKIRAFQLRNLREIQKNVYLRNLKYLKTDTDHVRSYFVILTINILRQNQTNIYPVFLER